MGAFPLAAVPGGQAPGPQSLLPPQPSRPSGAFIRRSASGHSWPGVSWSAGAVQNRNVAVLAPGRTRLMIVRCGSVRANSCRATRAEADQPSPAKPVQARPSAAKPGQARPSPSKRGQARPSAIAPRADHPTSPQGRHSQS
jgi:hypothetical protein